MKKNKIFYGWWIVVGCVLITATIVPPVVALANKYLLTVTEDMGISRSQFTLTSTICMSLGIFISPYVAKRLATGNMKRIQSIGIIGYALAYASYSLAQNQYHLYLSAIILGICFICAGLIPVSMLITNWFEKKRGLAMSIAMTGIGVGGMIFSPLITFLLGQYGWRWSYRIMGLIILVIALPVSLFIFRRKPEDMGLVPYGYKESETKSKKTEISQKNVRLSVKDSYTKPFFIILLFGIFLNGIVNSGALGQFPPALSELHGPQIEAAIISLYSFVGIFGKLILGWVNDRFGIVASTLFGCLTFGFAFIFMLMGKNVSMLYLMGFIFGLGTPIGTVSPPLLTSAVFGPEKYAVAYGIVNSVAQIGTSIGSLVVAAIYDTSGSYQIAWILLFILTMATMVCWLSSYKLSRSYC